MGLMVEGSLRLYCRRNEKSEVLMQTQEQTKKFFKAVWSDGYITTVIQENNRFKLYGKIETFATIEELEKRYKGKIKQLTEERQ